MILNTINYLPGKGKTEEAVKKIKLELETNKSLKCIYVIPSISLANEIKTRMEKEGIEEKYIHVINSKNIQEDETVKKNIINHRLDYTKDPSIMIITAKSFLNLENITLNEELIIIDEALPVMDTFYFRVEEEFTKFILDNYIGIINYSNNNFYELKLSKSLNEKDHYAKIISDDILFKSIRSSNKKVLVSKTEFDSYLKDKRNNFVVYILTDVSFIDKNSESIILGFDVDQTPMGLVFEDAFNHKFNEIKNSDVTKYSYPNPIEIIYFSDKDLGNYKLRSNSEISLEITNKLKSFLPKDINLTDFNFGNYKSNLSDNLVGAVSHGLNKPEWTSKDVSVILSNYRMTPEEIRLFEFFGRSIEEMDRARDINMKIQIFTRNSIRTGKDTSKTITLVVLDKRTAEGIKDNLPNCNIKISKLKSDVEKIMVYTTTKRIVTISYKERRRIQYLRTKKKNNPDKFTSKEQNELTKLVLKMNTKP